MKVSRLIFLIFMLFLVSCSPTSEILEGDNENSQFQKLKAEGVYFGENQEYFSAIGKFKRALELNPEDGETFLLLGFAYQRIRNYEGAIVPLENAALLLPENHNVRKILGEVYRELGLYVNAEAAFKKAFELNPGYSLAFAHIGEIGYQTKNYPKCRDYLKKYIELIESIGPQMLTEKDKLNYKHVRGLLVACENLKYPKPAFSPL